MWIIALVLGVSIAGLGMISIASPESVFEIFLQVRKPVWLYVAAGSRVVLGISLLVSAINSRAPSVLRVLGWVFLAAGLLLPIFGFEFFQLALYHFSSLGYWAARIWGCIALGLGLFIAYAVVPRRRTV